MSTGANHYVNTTCLLNEFPRISLLQCVDYFVIGGSWLAHQNVLFNACVEENGLLLNITYLLAELSKLYFIYGF